MRYDKDRQRKVEKLLPKLLEVAQSWMKEKMYSVVSGIIFIIKFCNFISLCVYVCVCVCLNLWICV